MINLSQRHKLQLPSITLPENRVQNVLDTPEYPISLCDVFLTDATNIKNKTKQKMLLWQTLLMGTKALGKWNILHQQMQSEPEVSGIREYVHNEVGVHLFSISYFLQL